MTWLQRHLRSGIESLLFRNRKSKPCHAGQSRKGDNLWTCSIVALESRHGQNGVVFSGIAARHPRLGCRGDSGVDRWRGRWPPTEADRAVQPQWLFFRAGSHQRQEHLSKPFRRVQLVQGPDSKGQPVGDPAKFAKTDGVLVAPSVAAANWPPPSFSPDTGLFYVNATEGFREWYLTDTSNNPEGYGGYTQELWSQLVLKAIDYKTGKLRWSHPYASEASGGAPGILTTAGKVTFHRRRYRSFRCF